MIRDDLFDKISFSTARYTIGRSSVFCRILRGDCENYMIIFKVVIAMVNMMNSLNQVEPKSGNGPTAAG